MRAHTVVKSCKHGSHRAIVQANPCVVVLCPAVRVMDGDTIDITLTLAANHTGVHSFHIMPVTSESLPPRALLTQGVGSPSSLLATGHPPGPTNPLHGDAQWWIRSSGAPGSLWQNYTAQFKLPAGLVGEDNVPVRAVLRWQWVVRKDCDLLCGWLPANSSAPCGPYPLITPQNCASQPGELCAPCKRLAHTMAALTVLIGHALTRHARV